MPGTVPDPASAQLGLSACGQPVRAALESAARASAGGGDRDPANARQPQRGGIRDDPVAIHGDLEAAARGADAGAVEAHPPHREQLPQRDGIGSLAFQPQLATRGLAS